MIFPELHMELSPPEIQLFTTLTDDDGNQINEPVYSIDVPMNECVDDFVILQHMLFECYNEGYTQGYIDRGEEELPEINQ